MQETYKILMLDDHVDLQAMVRLTFTKMHYHRKKLELLSAYETEGGYEIMLDNPDIAMCIVDLNLEKKEAGLEFIRKVREELKNFNVSIFIMTAHQNLLWKYAYNAYEICGLLPKGYFDLDTFQMSIYQGLKRYEEKIIGNQVRALYMRLTKMLAMTFDILKETGIEGQYEHLERAIKTIIAQIEESQKNVSTYELKALHEKLLNLFDSFEFDQKENNKPHLRLVYSQNDVDSNSSQ